MGGGKHLWRGRGLRRRLVRGLRHGCVVGGCGLARGLGRVLGCGGTVVEAEDMPAIGRHKNKQKGE